MLFIPLACFITRAIASTVSVNIPIADQLPPTARVDTPYSWAFSLASFSSDSNASLTYSASSLPGWLTFEPSSRTLHGTPSDADEGHSDLTVSAQDSSSSASSQFSLSVSSYAAPSVNIPIDQQFRASNPSLSSVFTLSNDSALLTSNPALRIPPAWSYSIGIESTTFIDSRPIHYAALQADGSPLPSWVKFNPSTITLNGFTPAIHASQGPLIASLAIHAMDSDGYSTAAIPFDLIVATHELHASHSLPTINITAATPFNTSLNSAFDFSGVLVDNQPIQSSNVSTLSIDVSQYGDWLRYDMGTRQLSGTPPDRLDVGAILGALPVTIATEFNQSIHTNVSVAIVPSYFTAEMLGSLKIKTSDDVHFSLLDFLSNGGGRSTDIELSAVFDPGSADQYLSFDNATSQLTGKVPSSIDYDSVKVTFTAFSHITRSTSHASLDLSILDSQNNNTLDTSGITPLTRSKIILGVGITFGVVGGLFVLFVSLALWRRCARVQDTALEGEEGRRGWTEQEKRWYDLDDEQAITGESVEEKMVVDFRQMPKTGVRKYGSLGLGIRHLQNGLSRPLSNNGSGDIQSPRSAVMKKADFFDRLKSTVRVVSKKYRNVGELLKPGRPRLVIGKPTLLDAEDGRGDDVEDPVLSGTPASFSLSGSPTSSKQTPSIPARRADFAPPSRSTGPDTQTGRTHTTKHSTDFATSSSRSFSHRSSIDTHESEAVVHTARAMSVRSGKSVSIPYPSQRVGSGRPRLVPFTKSSRVPVPQIPPGGTANLETGSDAASSRRITSLTAEVEEDKEYRADDLSVAMDYVRTFGADPAQKGPRSFYSLESSHGSAATRIGVPTPRFLARVGERFIFTLCMTEKDKPKVRLVTGEELPKFLHVNVRGGAKGMVQLWGTPQSKDIGELEIGVYEREGGECIGRAIAEIVART